MISVEVAIKSVQKKIVPTTKFEDRTLKKALGYILFNDIISPINMPPFRQSAMDGYAVNLHNNKNYKLIGEVKAGNNFYPILKTGEAVRIFTGAAVPDSANAVVVQEIVTVNTKTITIEKLIVPNTNIRPLGEQVKNGGIALKKGTKLTSAAIGYLSSLGITKVQVHKKPKIAIVVTGSELIKSGKKLTNGKIYESNSVMLKSAIKSLGCKNITQYKTKDNYKKTYKTLQKTINKYDFVLISGGISVGEYDFVSKALQELQVEQLFYKVNQKPGKPLFFGKKNDTIIFALPGNPASALSCFYIYVQTALRIYLGTSNFSINRILAKSILSFTKKGDRAQFLKAILKNNEVTILEGQSSAMQQTFAIANALVYLPSYKSEIKKGELVEVISLPE